MYEVELKFRLADPAVVLGRLHAWGAQGEAPLQQSDLYFNHPSRDFVQTDEAFRIRSIGDLNFATYKGPVVDSQTKTRHEIEVGIASGAAAAAEFGEMLVLLGFRQAGVVRKKRVIHRLEIDGRAYELALDEVEGLGTYLEIETLANETQRSAARDGILAIAAQLGLSKAERKSYIALVLGLNQRASAGTADV